MTTAKGRLQQRVCTYCERLFVPSTKFQRLCRQACISKSRSEKTREHAREQWKDPTYRALKSKQAREQWKDPTHRKRMSEKSRERTLKQWQDPAYRARQGEYSRERWQDPAFRARMSEQVRANSQAMARPRIPQTHK